MLTEHVVRLCQPCTTPIAEFGMAQPCSAAVCMIALQQGQSNERPSQTSLTIAVLYGLQCQHRGSLTRLGTRIKLTVMLRRLIVDP